MPNFGVKKIVGMTSRQRGKTKIFLAGISMIILVFVVQQIMSKNEIIWVSSDSNNVEDRSEFVEGSETGKLMNVLQMLGESGALGSFTGERIIHLDLKGAAPLISFYAKLFPFFKRLGATGILIEYEDMFPYKDELEEIKAVNAYNSSDIKTILRLAEENDLIVIPLIQTMGHMEFVLKLARFREFREMDAYPQNVCPSHEKVHLLIEKMIDQIIEAHPKSKYIHIGCDEVFFLGKCDRCIAAMKENAWTPEDLFLNHVRRTALYMNKTHPGVRAIMWGDMLHHISGAVLESSSLPQLVDIMYWNYWPNVKVSSTEKAFRTFAKHFKSIWIASAFKGATTASSLIPNVYYHLANHKSWMKVVTSWKDYINFKGIALTGWQRYDHFAVLCELLPVGLPSLALDLTYLQNPLPVIDRSRLIELLECEWLRGLQPPDFKFIEGKCNFPGFEILNLVNEFVNFTSKWKSNSVARMKNGWFSQYNVVQKFASPYYVEKIFQMWPLEAFRNDLNNLEKKLTAALSKVYDVHTVNEWIAMHVTPIKMQMTVFLNARDTLLSQKVWPRRPFAIGSAFENASEVCGVDRTFGCALLMT